MSTVQAIHLDLGGPAGRIQTKVRAAPRLPGPVNEALSHQFKRELLESPLHFLRGVELQGFPLIRLQWIALCRTAGIVLLRSGRIDPDVFSLLLNGVETEEDLTLIRQHAPPLQPHWQAIMEGPRPVAVNGFLKSSRMQDSAVITTLGAFANAFFTQFGTNEE